MMIYLGKTARYLRESLGLSQRAMARELGVTHVHLCNIENNKSVPSAQLLERYREKSGIDLYVLAWCVHGEVEKLPARLRNAASELAEAWRTEIKEKLEQQTQVTLNDA